MTGYRRQEVVLQMMETLAVIPSATWVKVKNLRDRKEYEAVTHRDDENATTYEGGSQLNQT